VRVRDFHDGDWQAVKEMFVRSKLPENCFPNTSSPLYLIRKVVDVDGEIPMAAFTKVTAEQYLLLDHGWGAAQDRWELLTKLRDVVVAEAAQKGFEDLTAFVPPYLEKSFGPRLTQLGFLRSPWPSYTLVLP
jgi:hypothetical protein